MTTTRIVARALSTYSRCERCGAIESAIRHALLNSSDAGWSSEDVAALWKTHETFRDGLFRKDRRAVSLGIKTQEALVERRRRRMNRRDLLGRHLQPLMGAWQASNGPFEADSIAFRHRQRRRPNANAP